MCVCVCEYVYIFIYMCHIYVHTHTHTHTHKHTHMYVCVCVYLLMYVVAVWGLYCSIAVVLTGSGWLCMLTHPCIDVICVSATWQCVLEEGCETNPESSEPTETSPPSVTGERPDQCRNTDSSLCPYAVHTHTHTHTVY